MNFLQKQQFMRPLIEHNVPWEIRSKLYFDYINSRQLADDPYQGILGPQYIAATPWKYNR